MNHSTTRRRLSAAAVTGLAALAAVQPTVLAADAAGATGKNQLVALSDVDGSQSAARPSINGSAQVASYDGRFVVYSTSSPLVAEDTNGLEDVYVRDLAAGRTRLVSVAADGTIANSDSFEPTIDDDGTTIAFTTAATNLADDTNGEVLDVVVKDLSSGAVEVASVRTDGTQAGRNSFSPVVSGDGSSVALQTFGRFSAKDRDRREDVYVHHLAKGWTRQATLDARGRDLGSHFLVGDLSDDGRLVTFGDDNNAWVRDVVARQSTRVWHEDNDPRLPWPAGTVGRPVISGNGRFLAFTTMSNDVMKGDRGEVNDVFRIDLASGKVRRVAVSASGRPADGDSFIPSLSRTGRYVGFSSYANTLTRGEGRGSDTFVRDMRTDVTRLASGVVGGVADQESGRTAVAISGDGRMLVYESYASNLVAGDTNDQNDVIAWTR